MATFVKSQSAPPASSSGGGVRFVKPGEYQAPPMNIESPFWSMPPYGDGTAASLAATRPGQPDEKVGYGEIPKQLGRTGNELAATMTGTIPEFAGAVGAAAYDAARAPQTFPGMTAEQFQQMQQARDAQVPTPNPLAGAGAASREAFGLNLPELQPDPQLAPSETPYFGDAPIRNKFLRLQNELGGMVAPGVSIGAGTAIAGPLGGGALAGTLFAAEKYQELKDAGVPDDKALRQSALFGGGSAALFAIPVVASAAKFLPPGLASRVAVVAASAAEMGGKGVALGGVDALSRMENIPQSEEEWRKGLEDVVAGVDNARSSFVSFAIMGGVGGLATPIGRAKAQAEAKAALDEFVDLGDATVRPRTEPSEQIGRSGNGVDVQRNAFGRDGGVRFQQGQRALPGPALPAPEPQGAITGPNGRPAIANPRATAPLADAPLFDPNRQVMPEAEVAALIDSLNQQLQARGQRIAVEPIGGAQGPLGLPPGAARGPMPEPPPAIPLPPPMGVGRPIEEAPSRRAVPETAAAPEAPAIPQPTPEQLALEQQILSADLVDSRDIPKPAPEAPKTAKQKLAALRDARKQSLIDTTVAVESAEEVRARAQKLLEIGKEINATGTPEEKRAIQSEVRDVTWRLKQLNEQEAPTQPTSPSQSDVEPQTQAGAAQKQPWEMTREEYDLWRIDELNRRNPQLGGALKGEIVDSMPHDRYRSSEETTGMETLEGAHSHSTVTRRKNARSGTWTHEIRHMIDMLLGGNQVRAFIGDIRKNGDAFSRLTSKLKEMKKQGAIDPNGRLTDDAEVAQVALDAFYSDRAGLREVAPDLVDFLEKMGADKYADLNLPHRKAIEQAIASGKSVPPEVLAGYPDITPTPAPTPTTIRAAAQGYSVPEPPVEAVEAPKDPESQFQDDIRAISAESKEKRLKDLRREFMQNKGLSHTQENGIQQILHMSSKKSGSFQLSSIGADGIPNMDQEFDNISEAIAEFDRTVGKRRADLPDIALMLKPGEANFIYEPRLRPVDIGTIPKEGFVGRREGGKWGRAAFNRPLTEKELDQYELTPVGYEDNTGGSGLIEGAMNEQPKPTQPLTATANRAAMPEQREGTNYEKTLGAISDTLAGNKGVVADVKAEKPTTQEKVQALREKAGEKAAQDTGYTPETQAIVDAYGGRTKALEVLMRQRAAQRGNEKASPQTLAAIEELTGGKKTGQADLFGLGDMRPAPKADLPGQTRLPSNSVKLNAEETAEYITLPEDPELADFRNRVKELGVAPGGRLTFEDLGYATTIDKKTGKRVPGKNKPPWMRLSGKYTVDQWLGFAEEAKLIPSAKTATAEDVKRLMSGSNEKKIQVSPDQGLYLPGWEGTAPKDARSIGDIMKGMGHTKDTPTRKPTKAPASPVETTSATESTKAQEPWESPSAKAEMDLALSEDAQDRANDIAKAKQQIKDIKSGKASYSAVPQAGSKPSKAGAIRSLEQDIERLSAEPTEYDAKRIIEQKVERLMLADKIVPSALLDNIKTQKYDKGTPLRQQFVEMLEARGYSLDGDNYIPKTQAKTAKDNPTEFDQRMAAQEAMTPAERMADVMARFKEGEINQQQATAMRKAILKEKADAEKQAKKDAPKGKKKRGADPNHPESGTINLSAMSDLVDLLIAAAKGRPIIRFKKGLTESVFDASIRARGLVNKYERRAQQVIADFEQGYRKSVGGVKGMMSKVPDNLLQLGTDYLTERSPAGKQAILSQFPVEMQAPLRQMRTLVDELTQKWIDWGVVSPGRTQILKNNKGSYLSRQYKTFNEPNFRNIIPEMVKQRMRNLLRKWDPSIPNTKAGDDIIEGRLNEWIDVSEDENSGLMWRGSPLGARNFDIMKQRNDFPQEVLDLWGVERDVTKNLLNTVMKQAKPLANTIFQNKVLDHGRENNYIFTKADIEDIQSGKAPTAKTKAYGELQKNRQGTWMTEAAEQGKSASPYASMGVLADVYVPKPLKKAMEDMMKTQEHGLLMKTLLQYNGIAAMSKTVGSVTTQSLNFIANQGFFFGSGHAFYKPLTLANRINQALAMTGTELKSTWGRGSRDIAGRALELGVLNDADVSQEIAKLIEGGKGGVFSVPATKLSEWGDRYRANRTEKSRRAVGAAAQVPKWIQDVAGTLRDEAVSMYQAGDDFWKALMWLSETEYQAELNPSWSRAKAEEAAAVAVREYGLPFYSESPRFIQNLRYVPIPAPFKTYAVEAPRVLINQATQAKSEIFSGNATATAMGFRRSLGQAFAYGMPIAGSIASALAWKLSDQDEDTIRDMGPEWNRDSNFVHYNVDRSKGIVKYWNVSRTSVQSEIGDPINAFIRGDEATDKAARLALASLDPFLQEQLGWKALRQVIENEDDYGRPIYNDSDTDLEFAKKVGSVLGKSILPGTVESVRRILKDDAPIQKSLAEATGQRITTVNMPKELEYATRSYMASVRAPSMDVKKAESGGNASDIAEQKRQRLDYHKQQWESLHDKVSGMKAFGVDTIRIMDALKKGGMSQKNINNLMYGIYVPPESMQ